MPSIRTCWLALAVALSSATAAQAQMTAVFLDSQAGDWVGAGQQYDLAPPDYTFTAASTWNDGLSVSIDGLNANRWFMNFSPAAGETLTVGTYLHVARWPFTSGNGMDISGLSRGCNELTGRFVVLELVRDQGGSVTRLAVDFEQHCEDAGPALFGALRYNSTISDLTPFGGNYPVYQLTVPAPAHGRITGGGLDCGSGGGTCTVSFASPTPATLTGTADSGYVFAGWAGDCRGAQSTTVSVNSARSCTAFFEPLISAAPRTLLVLDNYDYVTPLKHIYSPNNSTWTVTSDNAGNHIRVEIQDKNRSSTINFAAPSGQPLTPGDYHGVTRYPFTPLSGMDVSGFGAGCNQLSGRFVIYEIQLAADGTVLRFAADFEQHCEGSVDGTFGAVRYNALFDPVFPFNGIYPDYRLAVVPAAHGRVTGVGIDCGASGAVCETVLPGPEERTLTAIPDPGYVFVGWTGDCRGWTPTSVYVKGSRVCQALFDTAVPSTPRSLFFLDYSALFSGRIYGVTPAASVWNVTSVNNGNSISVLISTADGYLTLDLSAPEGQSLGVGEYPAARRYPFTEFNGLSLNGGCNTLTGRFIILDLAIAPDGTVERLAADVEQHCDDVVPAAFASIRFNSIVSAVLPFDGNYPSYQLSLTPTPNGVVTGAGINCSTGGQSPAAAQCALTFGAAAQVTLVATPATGYVFMGWTDDCSGGTTTTLHVNSAKRCSARFEPSVAAGPRTVVRWNSDPGGIDHGRAEVFSSVNSRVTVASYNNGNEFNFTIDSVDPTLGSTWRLRFAAPAGEVLQAGRRYIATDSISGTGPSFEMGGNGSGCRGGEFTVRQVEAGPSPSAIRFAVDFILDCGAVPPSYVRGSLQYQSTLDTADAILTADPATLRFATLHSRVAVLMDPAPQTMRMTITRPNVGWTATSNQPWLQVTPASGTGSSVLTVKPSLMGSLVTGSTYNGAITVTLTDGSNLSKTVNVIVTLHLAGTTTAPFGIVDTPAPVTTGVTGAVPITGWALDDVEVTGVTICRGAVAPEAPPFDQNCGGTSQIYVGSAVFIEGARPDVQTGFPTQPRNTMGGWGFMVLTNTLPHQGNGTFVFYIYARDREGQMTLLGTRTMTCDNDHADAPFGTLDTPAQGETFSGSSFVNFGWVLTQNPKHIPTDGSTLMVYVDGVPVGSPSYNHARADIAAIFPGLANSNNAIGFKILDTTTLTNGLHTISWTATDSAGKTSGIGSRFFRVANGVASATAAASATPPVHALSLTMVPLESTPLVSRRSWQPDAPWRAYGAGASGRVVLRGEEIDRFDLSLGNEEGTYSGYLRVGTEIEPLPAGSHLNPESGAFTWSPGVGFVGAYDLVFVRAAGGQPVARREVRILIQAKGSGHVGVQAAIDTPRSQQDLAQPFALTGWAADMNAADGTGIDTLHVWAYPLTGGPPTFLGTAVYGGARPDVASIHGDQFLESGFRLMIDGLTPGNYDLAVFPWSSVSNAFAPPQVVRITAR